MFRTWYNYDYTKEKREINEMPSLTVPDQSYTIKQLLTNYTRMPAIQRNGSFDPDADFENIIPAALDLSDIDDYKEELSELTERINRAKKSKEGRTEPAKE